MATTLLASIKQVKFRYIVRRPLMVVKQIYSFSPI